MGQNTANVVIYNDTGDTIANVDYLHRYDSDHYDPYHLDSIPNQAQVSVGTATYWTGFGRTGYDYWWIRFYIGSVAYTCKANFYCYLTEDDANKTVTLTIKKDEMIVHPAESSSCSVSIYTQSNLHALLLDEYAETVVAASRTT